MTAVALFAGIAIGLAVFFAGRFLGKEGVWNKARALDSMMSEGGAYMSPGPLSLVKSPSLSEVSFLRAALSRQSAAAVLADLLKTCKVPVSVSVFLMMSVFAATVAYLFLRLWLTPLLAVFAALIAGFAPFLALRFLKFRRLNKFSVYFPDGISVLSSAIKVGHGIEVAMDAVTKTAPWPVNEEFRQARAEMKLGSSLQKALLNMEARVPLPEVKILTTGIIIHQEIGGNLSEILDNLERTIRDREALKREIKSLSSQGKMSAWVLFFIPIVLGMLWMWKDPHMFMGFVQSSGGRFGIGLSIVCQLAAFLWIRQIVELKD